jgi:hypothetical protein
MSMTRKDFVNCADAIANLRVSGTELNQVIVEFSNVFTDKYDNFDPTTFRNYIIAKHDEKRRGRLNDSIPPELKLIE